MAHSVSSGSNSAHALAVDAGGRYLIAGRSDAGAFVARVTAAGGLDTTFADAGSVVVPGCDARGLVVMSNGRIAAGGSCGGRLAALVLTAGGSLDASFNGDGIARGIEGGSGYGLAARANGTIVVGGLVNGQLGAVGFLP